MTYYIMARLASVFPVLLLVSLITFSIVRLIPSDPARILLGDLGAGETDLIEENRARLGLDRPLPVQFLIWLGAAATGDLGRSIYTGQPVLEAIVSRGEVTALLAVIALSIAVLLGVPLGVLAAVRHGSWADHVVMVISLVGLSVPTFWLGLGLILIFAVSMGVLPSIGYAPLADAGVLSLRYLLLPAVALGLHQAALVARMTRSAMLDVLLEDYVRTARSKGLNPIVVLRRHVLRNALIPVLTVIGLAFGALLGGAVIIEAVFALPGIGQLVVQSVGRRDYPVIQGALLVIAVVYMLLNLAIDLAYAYLDPRISYK